MPRFTASREQAELMTPVPPKNSTFILTISFFSQILTAANLLHPAYLSCR